MATSVITDSLIPGMIDTALYKDLPVWNAAMDTAVSRFDTKFTDTFSVDGNRFRFVNYTGQIIFDGEPIYLERLINKHWVVMDFAFGVGNHLGDFHHDRDVNGDGYHDITRNEGFVQEAFLYDPHTKNGYDGDSMIYINAEWQMIDTVNRIFCDFQEFKRLRGDISSTLYTFDGSCKHSLYKLELYNPYAYPHPNLITKFILYKVIKDEDDKATEPLSVPFRLTSDALVKVKEIKLIRPVNLDELPYYDESYFDYVKFWKEAIKKPFVKTNGFK